jgi:hypothetical protein
MEIISKFFKFKYLIDIFHLCCLGLLCLVFFYPTFLFHKLPIPSDDLVGLYHPWRDLYAKEYPQGIPYKNFLISDPIRQQIPWRKQVIDSYKQLNLPMWNSANFSGTPLGTNIQSGAYYPLNILFIFMSFPIAWTILIIIQPLSSIIFMYLYLRHRKLKYLSASMGAIIFTFSGFAFSWLTWGTILSVTMWTPLVLIAIDKLLKAEKSKIRIIWGCIYLFSLFCQLTAGHLQFFSYSLLLYSIFIIKRIWDQIKYQKKSLKIVLKSSLSLIVLTFIFILLTSFIWIPYIGFVMSTSRGANAIDYNLAGFFIPWQNIIQQIVPDFFGNPATLNYWGVWNYAEFAGYIGIFGWLIVITALLNMKKTNNRNWVLLIFIIILFIFPTPIALIPYLLKIPFLSSLQPTRMLFLITFSLSVISANTFEYFIKNNNSKKLYKPVLLFTSIIIGLWIFSLFISKLYFPSISINNLEITRRNIIIPSIYFTCIILLIFLRIFINNYSNKIETIKIIDKFLPYIFVLILISDLFHNGWKFTPFTDIKLFFPETSIIKYLENAEKPYRIMVTDDRILPPNTNGYYNIESISGYDPLYSSRYEEFMAVLGRNKPDLSKPYGFNRIITPLNINSKLLPLTNVKYVLTFGPLVDPKLKLIRTENNTYLYEYLNSLPRLYFAENIYFIQKKEDIIKQFYINEYNVKHDTIIEENISVMNMEIESNERINIKKYSNNQVISKTVSNGPRVLIFSTSFDKGWHVYIDNSESKILHANYIYMGVLVPGGLHTVRFEYHLI